MEILFKYKMSLADLTKPYLILLFTIKLQMENRLKHDANCDVSEYEKLINTVTARMLNNLIINDFDGEVFTEFNKGE